MANYCSNTIFLEGATSDGSRRFNELLENGGLDAGSQWIFDIDIYEEEIVHKIYFTTKWSLHDETVKFLVELLEADNAYCYYEEPGMAIAGKIVCNSDGIWDNDVIPEYWDDCNIAYEDYYDYPEIEDYLTKEKCLIARFNKLLSTINVNPSIYSFQSLELTRIKLTSYYA